MANIFTIKVGNPSTLSSSLIEGELGFHTVTKTLYIGTEDNVTAIGGEGAFISKTANPVKLKSLELETQLAPIYGGTGVKNLSDLEFSASQITSGILPVNRGGTGVNNLSTLNFSADQIASGVLSVNRGGTGVSDLKYLTFSTSQITSGILPVSMGGTGVNNLNNLGFLKTTGGQINGNLNVIGALQVNGTNVATVDDIQNVDIGGRNLATGTSRLMLDSTGTVANRQWRKSGVGTVNNVPMADSPVQSVTSGVRITTEGSKNIGFKQDGINLIAEQEYTASCWVRPSKAGVKFLLETFWSSTDSGHTKEFVLSAGWQRITFTDAPRQSGAHSNVGAFIPSSETQAGVYVDVCAIQLEKGNTATDWRPAPEDLESRYIGPTTVYIDSNATSSDIVTGRRFPTLNALFERLKGKVIENHLQIFMVTDCSGATYLSQVMGEKITINGQNHILNGLLEISDCNCRLFVNELTVNRTVTSDSAVGIHAGAWTQWHNCTIKGNGKPYGMFISQGACVALINCGLYNTAISGSVNHLLGLETNTNFVGYNLKGTGATNFASFQGCTARFGGTRPAGGMSIYDVPSLLAPADPSTLPINAT